MSRPQGRLRGPPPGGLRGFGKPPAAAATTTAARSGGGLGGLGGLGGFGGFSTSERASGLAYVAERYDLSTLSDAQAVVSFKNLLKKDGTTKARALKDLLAFVQAHPYDRGGVEDAILDAWTHYYPRLSIDDARKVRELAHDVLLALLQSARKRMERHMPQITGPWLAGTYDHDRAVAKAAADGVAFLLTSEDKARRFYQRLQGPVLAFAAAALHETPTTLSDMRSSSREDALLKYHRVLYSSLALVLAQLRRLDAADAADDADNADAGASAFAQLFDVDAVWSAALAPDSHVRRTAYELYRQCLETRPALLDAHRPRLAKLLIQDAPAVRQTGSLVAYLAALQTLSEVHPEVWSQGPTHPFSRLRPLLETGSQGLAATPAYSFWLQLDALFASIPAASIPADAAADVLASFRTGLASRDEPPSNFVDGWTAYLSTVRRMIDALVPREARVALVETHVYPLFDQELQPQPQKQPAKKTAWSTGTHVSVLARAALLLSRPAYPDIVDATRRMWTRLADGLAGRMANSLPEVSQAFRQSQEDVAGDGARWFTLASRIHAEVQQAHNDNQADELLAQPSLSIVQGAADLLRKRNFKPFGAAKLVRAALQSTPHLLCDRAGQALVSQLFPTDEADQLRQILASPSAEPLLSCLRTMAGLPALRTQYESVYGALVALLVANSKDTKADANTTAKYMALLLTDASEAALATSRRNEALQHYLVEACLSAAAQSALAGAGWDLFRAVFASNALSAASSQALVAGMVHALDRSKANLGGALGEEEEEDDDDEADMDVTAEDRAAIAQARNEQQSLLQALEVVAGRRPELLVRDDDLHLELMTKLLSLVEVRDTGLSAKAIALRALVDRGSSSEGGERPLLRILRDHLDSAAADSLEIDTLVEQASSLSETATAEDKEGLFPDTNVWMHSMQAFLQGGLSPALSLTSSLGGGYLLVPRAPDAQRAAAAAAAAARDRHGHAVPARMAAYTAKLIAADDHALAALPRPFQVELLYMLYLVAGVGSDQLAMADASSLWGDLADDPWAQATAEESIAEVRATLARVVGGPEEDDAKAGGVVEDLIAVMLGQTRAPAPTPLAVYTARALGEVLQARAESRGGFSVAVDEPWLARLDLWKKTSSPETALGALAVLTGYGALLAPSKTVSNFFNRLISDAAGAKAAAHPEATLSMLVLLDACMAVYDDAGPLPVATNRLVFAVKQITSWFGEGEGDEAESLDLRLAAASCRVLRRLLPGIKDIYGPHWERTLQFCLRLWDRAARALPGAPGAGAADREAWLPSIQASLKLVDVLERVEEANDDLADAVSRLSGAQFASQLRLLEAMASGVARTQPQQVVDRLLARAASRVAEDQLVAAADGAAAAAAAAAAPPYGLLASDAWEIQHSGYSILARVLRAQQAELSLNSILDKTAARLPAELVSLLLNAPAAGAFSEEALATFPAAVRTYLWSWCLVYDAFGAASAKVRGDYAAQLGEGGGSNNSFVAALLDFAVAVLGHAAARPLNLERARLSRDDMTAYRPWVGGGEEEAQRQMQQALVNVYFRTLTFVPGHFRAWYAGCRSKQTKVAVEAWTAKYVSPQLVDEALDEVDGWAAAQEGEATTEAGVEERALTVVTSRRAREAVAMYAVDEDQTLAMALRLPANYPIDAVAVEGVHRVAVDERKWQSWLRITQGVIVFSNGSLVDGLATFRRNVVGALRGQTECAICYSIISADKKMPDKRCATCKNLFHRACLYRWFQSSNQNSCPLCRNPISFLGSDTRARRMQGEEF